MERLSFRRVVCVLSACLLLSTVIGRAQTVEELQQARRARAQAAYLEVMGETGRAIEYYELSLQFLPDDAIVDNMSHVLFVYSPEGHLQQTFSPGSIRAPVSMTSGLDGQILILDRGSWSDPAQIHMIERQP